MKNKLLMAAILLSVNFHFASGIALWYQASTVIPVEPEPIVVEMLDELKTPAVEVAPAEPIKSLKLEQIVEEDPIPINDDVDLDSTLLGAHNQRVEKETVAEKVGAFKNVEEKKRKTAKEKDEDEMAALPVLGADEDTEALSQSDDHFKDKQKGLETLLNTREFAHFAYYKQIKTQLTKYWELKIKEKMMVLVRQDRSIAMASAQITRLFIVLDKNGTLVGVQVLNESGVRDLDEVAIAAFQEAAPFPNPPPGIVDKDGLVKIRWDFVVESGG